jgi:hypothetical protein
MFSYHIYIHTLFFIYKKNNKKACEQALETIVQTHNHKYGELIRENIELKEILHNKSISPERDKNASHNTMKLNELLLHAGTEKRDPSFQHNAAQIQHLHRQLLSSESKRR